MEHKDLFEAWVTAMGYNSRQVSVAGELIGLSKRDVTRVRSGERDLKKAELLAMAALRAGLVDWSPETDKALQAISLLRDTLINKDHHGDEAA